MIDHLDKQTQPMDLEPKRGRGRPATGQALSNAERQRLYRERQKAQRNENDDAKRVRALEKELAEIKAMYQLRSDQLDDRIAEVQRLKAELTSRNEKANPLNAAAELINTTRRAGTRGRGNGKRSAKQTRITNRSTTGGTPKSS
ncbi:hypothetical protein IG194_30160 [Pseudomonas sp. ADPe]|uniref:hypothetical protein n=1 Tax=Pseudomonas sp. ADPe TaxID=2774873 RepID=UPI001780DFAA|nr:hypothetical protein [Pseudomonas sp. ADPe]QOF84731.1 hypothetical protein IG194_30160 [Pseudomonas sp. ADPe]